jgi:hypothetical protein
VLLRRSGHGRKRCHLAGKFRNKLRDQSIERLGPHHRWREDDRAKAANDAVIGAVRRKRFVVGQRSFAHDRAGPGSNVDQRGGQALGARIKTEEEH